MKGDVSVEDKHDNLIDIAEQLKLEKKRLLREKLHLKALVALESYQQRKIENAIAAGSGTDVGIVVRSKESKSPSTSVSILLHDNTSQYDLTEKDRKQKVLKERLYQKTVVVLDKHLRPEQDTLTNIGNEMGNKAAVSDQIPSFKEEGNLIGESNDNDKDGGTDDNRNVIQTFGDFVDTWLFLCSIGDTARYSEFVQTNGLRDLGDRSLSSRVLRQALLGDIEVVGVNGEGGAVGMITEAEAWQFDQRKNRHPACLGSGHLDGSGPHRGDILGPTGGDSVKAGIGVSSGTPLVLRQTASQSRFSFAAQSVIEEAVSQCEEKLETRLRIREKSRSCLRQAESMGVNVDASSDIVDNTEIESNDDKVLIAPTSLEVQQFVVGKELSVTTHERVEKTPVWNLNKNLTSSRTSIDDQSSSLPSYNNVDDETSVADDRNHNKINQHRNSIQQRQLQAGTTLNRFLMAIGDVELAGQIRNGILEHQRRLKLKSSRRLLTKYKRDRNQTGNSRLR